MKSFLLIPLLVLIFMSTARSCMDDESTASFINPSELGDSSQRNVAFQSFIEKAHQGNREAQHNYSVMLLNGWEVEKNEPEAFRWALKAAQQGIADAQYNCGTMLFHGDGVEKNTPEAEAWLKKAAHQKNELSSDIVRSLEKMLEELDHSTISLELCERF